jgi:hypothetical protein
MQFRLRTLLIVLALGPPLLALGWWLVMTETGRPYLSLAVLALIAGVVTWFWYAPERRYWREVARREPLDDAEFIRQFYADGAVPAEIILRLRPLYCRMFGFEIGKLRPTDRPPALNELDTTDFVWEIEEEFGIDIPDQDAENIDGSFDAIVRYLASRPATTKMQANA